MDELKKRFMAMGITTLIVAQATADLPEEHRASIIESTAQAAADELREAVASGTVNL